MKRVYLVLILILIAALLCCCTTGAAANFDELNKKTEQNYSKIVLVVTSSYSDGTELIDTFTMEYSNDTAKVTYYIRRFTEITDEGSDQFITTTSGVAYLQSDGTVEFADDGIDLSVDKIANFSFAFQSDYFSNVQMSKTNFSASVVNPSAFLGAENFDGSNMKVAAQFDDSLFQNITYSYLAANGTNVKVEYVFFG